MGKKLRTLGLIVLTAAVSTSAAYITQELYYSYSETLKDATEQIKQYITPTKYWHLK